MDSAERLAVAEWVLHGNRCWIGLTVERHLGRAEYVAIYQPGPYAAPAVIPKTHSDNFFESLRMGKEWLEALDSQSDKRRGMKHDLYTAELPVEGSGFQKCGCRRCMKIWTVFYGDHLLYDQITTEECFANDASGGACPNCGCEEVNSRGLWTCECPAC